MTKVAEPKIFIPERNNFNYWIGVKNYEMKQARKELKEIAFREYKIKLK